MARILVVEDEKDLQEVLAYNLRQAGHVPILVGNGRDAISAVSEHRPDLVLLDLMLPDVSGIEVGRRLKGDTLTRELPIVMVTAKGDEVDRVVGFELGADDYVVKPFSVRELVLRVGAIMRTRRPAPTNGAAAPQQRRRYSVGPLELDVDGYHVFVTGKEVHVSTLEMRLLVYLVEHRGRVRSREDLLEDVWGYKPGVSTRTIDTHVKRLRDKLGEAGSLVETVRGTGYRLSAEHAVVVKE